MSAREQHCWGCSAAITDHSARFCGGCGAPVVEGPVTRSRLPVVPRGTVWSASAVGVVIAVGLVVGWATASATAPDLEVSLPAVPVGPEGEAPDRADLDGVWLQVQDARHLGLLLSFDDDAFVLDDGGHLARIPDGMGTYAIARDRLTLRPETSSRCPEPVAWDWRARVTAQGWLRVEQPAPAVGRCRTPVGAESGFLRLSPGSPLGGALAVDEAGSGEPVRPGVGPLAGVWLEVDGRADPGLLLRFTRDGRFAIDAHGDLLTRPEVGGTYVIEDDELHLDNEVAGPCGAGEGWIWRTELRDAGVLTVEGNHASGTACPAADAPGWRFVRVSPLSRSSAAIDVVELRALVSR